MSKRKRIWIARDYAKCSGCRRCEIACSLVHEGKIWPEASRIRIFMLVPGLEIPHLCVQCHDYPCVDACPVNALSVNEKTEAVTVDKEKCTACGLCIDACPGRVPFIHPRENYVVICDLCEGNPKCVEECSRGRWHALQLMERDDSYSFRLYARTPEEITKELAVKIYGEKGLEVL